MNRWRSQGVGVALLAASIVGLLGCGDDGGDLSGSPADSETGEVSIEGRTTTPGDDAPPALATSLGCDVVPSDDPGAYGYAPRVRAEIESTFDCELDGRTVGRLHTFPPEDALAIEERFAMRYDSASSLNRCSDSTVPRVPTIVLGDTWVLAAYDPQLIQAAVERHDGTVQVGNGDGPPVSYPGPSKAICPDDS